MRVNSQLANLQNSLSETRVVDPAPLNHKKSAKFSRRARGILRLVAALITVEASTAEESSKYEPGWRSDWATEKGFLLDIDTDGYNFPSAIAFVSEPGPGPDDPLYFVTELRGRIKVVTRDRSVHVFADNFFQLEPESELPDNAGQVGLAGICLDADTGYVFVTYAYQDESGVLRNNITRFQTQPGAFSLQPQSRLEFRDVFKAHTSGLAHQIGGCQIDGGYLYVGVGDGWNPQQAQNLDALNGKLLRMTLDGEPVPENPFYVGPDRTDARNYVLAFGFRNPFSLRVIDGRVIVAENGIKVDRFLEIQQGINYLWTGDDRVIASNAAFVWTPSIGPTQMDRLESTRTPGFPESYDGGFLVGTSAEINEDTGISAGVMYVPYDLESKRVTGAPQYVIRLVSGEEQIVAALSLGPDGLYFAPLYPYLNGNSPIIRASYSSDHPGEGLLSTTNPRSLMLKYGCLGCHEIFGKGGHGGSKGPPINLDSLAVLFERLNSDAYRKSLDDIDAISEEPQSSYRVARDEMRSAAGWERVRLWLKYRVIEPHFDTRFSSMPNQGVSYQEADLIAGHLLGNTPQSTGPVSRLKRLAPNRDQLSYIAAGMMVGIVAGTLLISLAWLVSRRRRSSIRS